MSDDMSRNPRPTDPITSRLFTPKEIASALNVSLKTIYYWVGRNQIPFIKLGKHLRFEIAKVINHFQSQTDLARAACVGTPHVLKMLESQSSLTTSKTTRLAGKESRHGD